MRVVLWGYDRSAEAKLETLGKLPGVRVVGVVVPSNRSAAKVRGIKMLARKSKIKVFQPRSLKSKAFEEKLQALKPDIFIVDSYPKLIPERFLRIPALGAYNFHPGKLPQYRGAHVLNWAIINGEKEITLTAHRMDTQFDHGEVLFEQPIEITFFDTINSVFAKTCEAGKVLVRRLINALQKDSLKGRPQDHGRARQYPARTPDDGKIRWDRTNLEIYNLIRALLPPWPCAFFDYKGRRVKVREAYPVPFPSGFRPGTVTAACCGSFCVSTGRDTLLIKAADKMNFSAGEILR